MTGLEQGRKLLGGLPRALDQMPFVIGEGLTFAKLTLARNIVMAPCALSAVAQRSSSTILLA